MYESVFGQDILDQSYPEYDESKIVEDEISLPIQVNGKFKTTIKVSRDSTQDEIVSQIKSKNLIELDNVKKTIYVPNKIINFIV